MDVTRAGARAGPRENERRSYGRSVTDPESLRVGRENFPLLGPLRRASPEERRWHESCTRAATMKRGLMAAGALALSLCAAAPARAEDAATRVMTLSEAIAWARAHQPSVRAAIAR